MEDEKKGLQNSRNDEGSVKDNQFPEAYDDHADDQHGDSDQRSPFDYFQEQWTVSKYGALSNKEKERLFNFIEASITGEEYRRPKEYTMENLRDDLSNYFL